MRRRTGLWIALAAALAACSSSTDDAALPTSRGMSNNGTGTGSGGTASLGGINSSDAGAIVPPEQEADQSFRAPVVSGRWVWTANPDTGKVAIVDAKTFGVRLADAGQAPTYLTALPTAPNTSRALVINTKSNDATLLNAGETGAVVASSPIPLQADANTWTVSTSGRFAIAWTDTAGLTPDPAQFFQDISVVDLSADPAAATRLVVGVLPSRVFIEDDEKMAFVVATSGISVVDLDGARGPKVLREVQVSNNLNEDATTRDVSVLPDGSYALVRHDGSAIITLVKLDDGTREDVTLPGPVTDLDLVSDAKSALAVVRGDPFVAPGSAGASGNDSDAGDNDASTTDDDAGTTGSDASAPDASTLDGSTAEGGAPNTGSQNPNSTLAILPLPGIFSAPNSFQTISIDEIFGQVNIAPEGTEALLFTNAIASTHLTLLQTAPGTSFGEHRTVDVHGDVKDVFPSPDGAYAIASLEPNGTLGKPGFAVVPVGSTLPTHTQTTEAPVFAVAASSSPDARAIITVSDNATNFAAYVVRMPELVVDRVSLPSRPLAGATGLVPDAGMAYIAESHPEGRITFIDLETGVPRTITGFEIASKVVNGN